jgi:Highly conserved protein containing a thioredoxin domain
MEWADDFGFAKGARILDDDGYLAAAERAAEFILTRMQRDGMLLRRFREGDAAINGFLDDYAFFTQALLDLYEAALDAKYLDRAVELTRKMLELFEDSDQGAFFSTAGGDPHLVMRMKEDYDGAEPSGNSIAALNCCGWRASPAMKSSNAQPPAHWRHSPRA